jgi:hypothetical protein
MNLNPIPFIVEQLVAAKNDLGRESVILSQSFKCLLLLIATVTSVVGSQFVMEERIGCHGDDNVDKSNVEMHCLTFCFTINGANSLHPGSSVNKFRRFFCPLRSHTNDRVKDSSLAYFELYTYLYLNT